MLPSSTLAHSFQPGTMSVDFEATSAKLMAAFQSLVCHAATASLGTDDAGRGLGLGCKDYGQGALPIEGDHVGQVGEGDVGVREVQQVRGVDARQVQDVVPHALLRHSLGADKAVVRVAAQPPAGSSGKGELQCLAERYEAMLHARGRMPGMQCSGARGGTKRMVSPHPDWLKGMMA